MLDRFGRNIDYMRISITDRCNLRCRYCMPDGIQKVAMHDILTYEEIAEIVRIAAGLGIKKYKITGGEPLARLHCDELIGMLHEIPGVSEITMTTNGTMLREQLPALVKNGLSSVNISLDTFDRERFREITGRDQFEDVIDGIRAAVKAGIRVKINTVLQKGENDQEWPMFLELTKNYPIDVRFIEMMPIGYGKQVQGISNDWLLSEMKKAYPDLAVDLSRHGNGPARYVKIPGAEGSIGFISAIHGKFCQDCNRIRLTSTGKLKPCLCYGDTVDLLPALRQDANAYTSGKTREETLTALFREAIEGKPEAHCFERYSEITEEHEMSMIGG